MKPMTTALGLSCAICVTVSGCTLSSTSASASTCAGESAQVTLLKRVSGKRARSPAPRSMSTRAPSLASFSATSGTKLTRVSCGALSRSAPIVTGIKRLSTRVADRPRC